MSSPQTLAEFREFLRNVESRIPSKCDPRVNAAFREKIRELEAHVIEHERDLFLPPEPIQVSDR